MSRARWTRERVAMLRALWELGSGNAAIANALGLSRNAVIGKARRLGLLRGKPRAPRAGGRALSTSIAIAREIPFAPADGRCQYPSGIVGEPDFHFCGAVVRIGSSYCETHHQRCYEQPDIDGADAAEEAA